VLTWSPGGSVALLADAAEVTGACRRVGGQHLGVAAVSRGIGGQRRTGGALRHNVPKPVVKGN